MTRHHILFPLIGQDGVGCRVSRPDSDLIIKEPCLRIYSFIVLISAYYRCQDQRQDDNGDDNVHLEMNVHLFNMIF